MKLSELYSKPLKEAIEALELADVKVHADEEGNVKAVELKYAEKREKQVGDEKRNPWS